MGMSGSGKSLLLRHLVRLMRPDKGRVLVDGVDVAKMLPQGIGGATQSNRFVFQSGALFDSETVFDNVAFSLREKTRLSETAIRSRCFGRSSLCWASDAVGKYPAQLSGGMLKRVALARTLVRAPEIILFDEPTTGLVRLWCIPCCISLSPFTSGSISPESWCPTKSRRFWNRPKNRDAPRGQNRRCGNS